MVMAFFVKIFLKRVLNKSCSAIVDIIILLAISTEIMTKTVVTIYISLRKDAEELKLLNFTFWTNDMDIMVD
jgi:hypothetical protein